MPTPRAAKPKDTDTVVTSIKLEAALYKRLRRRALDEGRATRLLVEDAIRLYLREGR
jgi:hypothetical protein